MRARLMEDGDGQIIVFPSELQLAGSDVLLTHEGDGVRLTPIANDDSAPEAGEIET